MDESEIKSLINQVPSKEPDKEFVDNLYERLGVRAEEMYEKSQKPSRSVLFPWKMSLAFASFCFILIFSFLLFVSPDVKESLEGYIDQESLAGLSTETEVTIIGVDESTVIFVYDKEEEDTPPLDVDTIEEDGTTILLLKPGEYKVVILRDAEIIEEQVVIITEDSDPINIDIKE